MEIDCQKKYGFNERLDQNNLKIHLDSPYLETVHLRLG